MHHLLPCKLSKAERVALDGDMAEVLCVITATLAKRDLLDKQLAALQERARVLTAKRRSGVELRSVPIKETPSWRRKRVIVRRADTGQKVGERPMRFEDRQLLLVPGTAENDQGNRVSARAPERVSARARVRREASK